MVSTDPIADMLTRIRNAVMVNKAEISLPHSLVKEKVARILVEEGFLSDVTVEDLAGRKILSIKINDNGSSSAITEIARISKPGRRVYAKTGEIPTIKRGRGIVIVSTSQGVMAGSKARDKRLGGELICKVY